MKNLEAGFDPSLQSYLGRACLIHVFVENSLLVIEYFDVQSRVKLFRYKAEQELYDVVDVQNGQKSSLLCKLAKQDGLACTPRALKSIEAN